MSLSNVTTLAEDLREMPISMRLFSVSMRALYADKSVSSQSDRARKFNKLRDETRRDAVVYVEGVLPVSTTLVRSVSEFFEYYIELDYDDWADSLGDIVEEVKGYRQCCKEVVKMHEEIMTPLQKREDDAKVLVKELRDLSAEYERKKAELEASASIKQSWAIGLAFLPVVNVIATPLLLAGAESDTAEAVAKGFQCKQNEAAILVVSDTMIPALKDFIGGLNSAAGFFNVIENELTTFQGKGEKAMEDKKKLHYKMMNKKAAEIKGYCQSFYAMIPGVRSDFLAIPNQGTDQNYVDRWLARKKEEIRKEYQHSGITGQLRKMISYLSVDEANQLMPK